ncbi:hypothetical protein GGF46_005124 [Coemansia sp. RSA 552]|nr:hypothetical protein GGF46_005124 [Coemansia sp. RSA 552]
MNFLFLLAMLALLTMVSAHSFAITAATTLVSLTLVFTAFQSRAHIYCTAVDLFKFALPPDTTTCEFIYTPRPSEIAIYSQATDLATIPCTDVSCLQDPEARRPLPLYQRPTYQYACAALLLLTSCTLCAIQAARLRRCNDQATQLQEYKEQAAETAAKLEALQTELHVATHAPEATSGVQELQHKTDNLTHKTEDLSSLVGLFIAEVSGCDQCTRSMARFVESSPWLSSYTRLLPSTPPPAPTAELSTPPPAPTAESSTPPVEPTAQLSTPPPESPAELSTPPPEPTPESSTPPPEPTAESGATPVEPIAESGTARQRPAWMPLSQRTRSSTRPRLGRLPFRNGPDTSPQPEPIKLTIKPGFSQPPP